MYALEIELPLPWVGNLLYDGLLGDRTSEGQTLLKFSRVPVANHRKLQVFVFLKKHIDNHLVQLRPHILF